MITQFEKLTKEEAALLFRAPVLVSVLAATSNHKVNEVQKADAIKLAHLKTFTANPLLLPYYKEVAENFERNFEEAVKKYAPFDEKKRKMLEQEIEIVKAIIAKLDTKFASKLQYSLSKYEKHVRKAERMFLDDFIFPVPIHGLTD